MLILLVMYLMTLAISLFYFIYTGYIDYKTGYDLELGIFLGMCFVVFCPILNLFWIGWCLKNVNVILLKGKRNG